MISAILILTGGASWAFLFFNMKKIKNPYICAIPSILLVSTGLALLGVK